MTPTTIGAAAGCCAVAAVASLWMAIRMRRHRARGPAVREAGGQRRWRALGALVRPQNDGSLELLRDRAAHAGLYGQDALDLYLTVRLIVLLAGAGLGILMITSSDDLLLGSAAGVALAGMAIVLPSIWLDNRARRRQQAITAELPATLSLLVVSLQAGLSLQQALERVVVSAADERRRGVLTTELALVLHDIQVGISLDTAFRRFAARTGSEEVRSLAGAIAWGATLGSKVAGLLERHAETLRRQRAAQLEENAGKASAKLTLPLSICLLPAGMLLLVGPAFIEIMRSL